MAGLEPGEAALDSPVKSTLPAEVHNALGLMWFSVNVPVLSVQITSVEPSVSTAERRLTTAPRRARSRTPMANAKVMTGSSPSGTLPAISPTANTKAAEKLSPPPRVAIGMNAAAMATAIAAISQATVRT